MRHPEETLLGSLLPRARLLSITGGGGTDQRASEDAEGSFLFAWARVKKPCSISPKKEEEEERRSTILLLLLLIMSSEAAELELPLVQDLQLTELMRIRVKTLQQKKEKPQDGEKLLQANEFVFRLDFSRQQGLRFLSWEVTLEKPGKATVIGTSQHWTPDLTHLMRRQLLDPVGEFWKKPEAPDVVDCNEADALEFGERLTELAKIRKAMYFLVAFTEGLEPAHLKCSVRFKI